MPAVDAAELQVEWADFAFTQVDVDAQSIPVAWKVYRDADSAELPVAWEIEQRVPEEFVRVATGRTFTVTIAGAPPGLAAILGLTIYREGETAPLGARHVGAFTELPVDPDQDPGTRVYEAQITASYDPGLYVWVADDGAGTETGGGFEVDFVSAGGIYATLADCRAYIADADTGVSDDDLTSVLQRAERDIDRELRTPDTTARDTTGLKFNPADLAPWMAAALSRATCAQVEYRLVMGEEFFVRAQHTRVAGPDFTTEGQLPLVAPQAIRELNGTGLLRDRHSVQLTSPYMAAPANTGLSVPDQLLP